MRSRDREPEPRGVRRAAPAAALLALQHTAGNHAVARWLARVEDPLDPSRNDPQPADPDPFYDDPQTAIVEGYADATLPEDAPRGKAIEVPAGSLSFQYGFTPDLSGMQLGPQL